MIAVIVVLAGIPGPAMVSPTPRPVVPGYPVYTGTVTVAEPAVVEPVTDATDVVVALADSVSVLVAVVTALMLVVEGMNGPEMP